MKKILLIDDSTAGTENGTAFLKQHPNLSHLIDVMTDLSLFFINDSPNSNNFHFDENVYEYVLLHDTFHSDYLNASQIQRFRASISNLIVFSGGIEATGFHLRATSRALLFQRLHNALITYQETNLFPIKYLCDNNLGIYYLVCDELISLIQNNDKELFLQSHLLMKLLLKLNYTPEQINDKILPNYRTLLNEALIDKLRNWKFKNF